MGSEMLCLFSLNVCIIDVGMYSDKLRMLLSHKIPLCLKREKNLTKPGLGSRTTSKEQTPALPLKTYGY